MRRPAPVFGIGLAVRLFLVAMTRHDAAVRVRIGEVVLELTTPKAMRLLPLSRRRRAAAGALGLISVRCVTSISLHGRALLSLRPEWRGVCQPSDYGRSDPARRTYIRS